MSAEIQQDHRMLLPFPMLGDPQVLEQFPLTLEQATQRGHGQGHGQGLAKEQGTGKKIARALVNHAEDMAGLVHIKLFILANASSEESPRASLGSLGMGGSCSFLEQHD
jgi:hypothetical protein